MPSRGPDLDLDLSGPLRQGTAELGLVLDEPTLRQLLDYLALMRKWNAVYNLTAVRDPAQMLVQHLLDSLAIVPALRRRIDVARATIADVGSGAGLPGIPIAILHPTSRVLSIEPVGKKTAFQRQACAELALTNVEIFGGRAEDLVMPRDLVLCRAFASLADFVAAARGLVGDATLLVAMKGQRTEIDTELAAMPAGWSADVEPVRVPFLAAERHLVAMRRSPDA